MRKGVDGARFLALSSRDVYAMCWRLSRFAPFGTHLVLTGRVIHTRSDGLRVEECASAYRSTIRLLPISFDEQFDNRCTCYVFLEQPVDSRDMVRYDSTRYNLIEKYLISDEKVED